jgi:hypothetical protein
MPLIEPFYRYNTLLYVNAAGAANLPAAILTTRVRESHPLREYGSWHWQLRHALLRNLPQPVIKRAAVVYARMRRLSRENSRTNSAR